MLISLIFGTTIFSFIFYSLVLISFFYALGSILQKFLDYKSTNKFYAIPIGFVIYQLITLLFYTVPIFFKFDMNLYETVELFKELTILFIIVYFYKAWLPNFKNYENKIIVRTIPYLFISTIVIFSIFFSTSELTNINTKHSNPDFLNGIYNLYSNKDSIFSVGSNQTSQIIILNRYQTFYYWIVNLTRIYVPLNGSSPLSNLIVIKYLIPSLLLFIVINISLATILDSEKSIISYIFSLIVSVAISALMLFSGPFLSTFYLIPTMSIILLLLFNYSIEVNPNNKTIVVALISLIMFVTLTLWSLILIAIFGILMVLVSFEKKGQGIRNAIIYTSIMFLTTIIMSAIYFIQGNNVTFSILYLISIIVLFIVIFIPLNSLENSSNRRADLVSFEKNLNKRIVSSVIIFSLIITIIMFLVSILLKFNLISLLKDFFIIFDTKWYVGLLIYILTILIPSITLLILKQKYKLSFMINLFAYTTLIFNPLTLIVICNLFTIHISLLSMLLPTVMLAFLGVVEFILKLIPYSLRL